MKKTFEAPNIEIIKFGSDAILTLSGTGSGNDELPDDNVDEL